MMSMQYTVGTQSEACCSQVRRLIYEVIEHDCRSHANFFFGVMLYNQVLVLIVLSGPPTTSYNPVTVFGRGWTRRPPRHGHGAGAALPLSEPYKQKPRRECFVLVSNPRLFP